MKEVKDSYLFDVLFRFDDFKINEPKTNNIYDTDFIGRVQLLNNESIFMPISGMQWLKNFWEIGKTDFVYPIKTNSIVEIVSKTIKYGIEKNDYSSKYFRNVIISDSITYCIREGLIYDKNNNILISASIVIPAFLLAEITDRYSNQLNYGEYAELYRCIVSSTYSSINNIKYQIRINNAVVNNPDYSALYTAVKNSLIPYLNTPNNENKRPSDFIDVIYTSNFPEVISRVRQANNLPIVPEINTSEAIDYLSKCLII